MLTNYANQKLIFALLVFVLLVFVLLVFSVDEIIQFISMENFEAMLNPIFVKRRIILGFVEMVFRYGFVYCKKICSFSKTQCVMYGYAIHFIVPYVL